MLCLSIAHQYIYYIILRTRISTKAASVIFTSKSKEKMPHFEAKKSMTKRGSAKSSFLRVIQFRTELVYEAFNWNKSKPILPFFVRLQSFSIFKANARRKNCVSMFFFPRARKRLKP